MAKLSIYKYVRSDKGWRYCKAAFHPNGKIKPDVVIVEGREEKHSEGSYFLNFNRKWLPVGNNALEAQRKRAVRLAQMEYERLSGKAVAPTQASSGAQLAAEGKLIRVEVDAYLANLELAKRPHRTVQSKRRFLLDFLGTIPKKFVHEFGRNDVLTFRNKQMSQFDPKGVETQMMCVVTFFNRWLKIKLGIETSDWPEYDDNDPEPYVDDEIVAMEKVSTGIPNLLVRLFRSVGCREMEIAHLNHTDITCANDSIKNVTPDSQWESSRRQILRAGTPALAFFRQTVVIRARSWRTPEWISTERTWNASSRVGTELSRIYIRRTAVAVGHVFAHILA